MLRSSFMLFDIVSVLGLRYIVTCVTFLDALLGIIAVAFSLCDCSCMLILLGDSVVGSRPAFSIASAIVFDSSIGSMLALAFTVLLLPGRVCEPPLP